MQSAEKLKERVALWLVTAPYGNQKIVAEALALTPRTLRQWKNEARKQIKKKLGRPKQETNLKDKIKIAKEWKRQGYPGSRPVIHALPQIRVRVVREIIAALKQRRKKRREKIRKEVRTSIKVKCAGVVLAMDGATKSHGEDYVVSRDRGSKSVNVEKCESSLNTNDVLNILTKLKDKNKLPLVFCTDNGSPLCSQRVNDFLEKNYIIHLKNLPHTPQHNGSCENAVRDFKELLNENLAIEDIEKTLNECRLRASLNWQTSYEFEKTNSIKFNHDERMEFYDKAKTNIKTAIYGINNAKEKRLRERNEILKTLEDFSFITIIRGSQSRAYKAEDIT